LYVQLDDLQKEIRERINNIGNEYICLYYNDYLDKKLNKVLLMKDKYKLEYYKSTILTLISKMTNDDCLIGAKKIYSHYDRTIQTNTESNTCFFDYVSKVENMLKNNNQKMWFGFNLNFNFSKLLYLCNIDINLLNYNANQDLTNKQKKYILLCLVKLCKKTLSKQVLYYLNVWAVDKNKCKGYDEFLRTFNYWFKFEKNFEKKKDLYTDCCNILMYIYRAKYILIKNTNRILNLRDIYENQTSFDNITQNNTKSLEKTTEPKTMNSEQNNEVLKNIVLLQIQKKRKQYKNN